MMEQNTQQSDQLASEFFDSNTVDDNSDTNLREQQEQYELYHTARHLPKDVAMAVGFSKTALQQYTAFFQEFLTDLYKAPNGFKYYSDADIDFLETAYNTCRNKNMSKEAYAKTLHKHDFEYPAKSVALVKQIQEGYSKQIELIRESITDSQKNMSEKMQNIENSINEQKSIVEEQTRIIEMQTEMIKDLTEKLEESTKKKKRFLLF